MAIDSKLLRHVMGKFPTGVTVVTTKRGETMSAMTANAVMSLSLDPPLIVISVDRFGSMHGLLEIGGCFAINVLTREQEHLSQRFSQRGAKNLSDLDTDVVETGAPVLRNALAYADCRIVDVARGGDHGKQNRCCKGFQEFRHR